MTETILTLHDAGHSQRAISEALGISRLRIRTVLREHGREPRHRTYVYEDVTEEEVEQRKADVDRYGVPGVVLGRPRVRPELMDPRPELECERVEFSKAIGGY